MKLSLIVATKGRTEELARLWRSLESQDFRDFEVILVDQNPDGRLGPYVEPGAWSFPIRWIRAPADTGVSRGRNVGFREAAGEIVLFPDDDCWYPPKFLSYGMEVMRETGADLVSGRSTDYAGRAINARFSSRARRVTRRSVWIAQMEWASFIRRDMLEALGGYDEGLGIGSKTPWQAAEGPDLILRALGQGRLCLFDPTLFGHHEEFDLRSDPLMALKGRAYARGMGYVLRRHGFGLLTILYWTARPLFRLLLAAGRGRFALAPYFLSVAKGRAEGWLAAAKDPGPSLMTARSQAPARAIAGG
jgi:glycosyltransferase involved in cell wall biosynthesis